MVTARRFLPGVRSWQWSRYTRRSQAPYSMVDDSVSAESDDERLKQLLAVEHRLQDMVRAARGAAATRIAAARAAGEQRLAAARDAAEHADAERARAERVSHQELLLAIAARHRATLAVLDSVPDSRIDELAHLALAQAIAGTGDAP